jgi:hypothetical protein
LVPISPYLKRQRQLIAKAPAWSAAELFLELAYPGKQDWTIAPAACDRRLASHYARAPGQTIAEAIQVIGTDGNLNAAIGAAQWLMTLGPAAEPALGALDRMGPMGSYAQQQARKASQFIRQSLLVTPEPSDTGQSARRDVSRLRREVISADDPGSVHGTLVEQLLGFLGHPDAYVRTKAANGLATVPLTRSQRADVTPLLERMLADDEAAEAGIIGEYECGGRLFHWRQVRYAPRSGAARALSAAGHIPEGDHTFNAMLAEAMHTEVVCGDAGLPVRFAIGLWRMAVEAAGGLSVVAPILHAAQQRCQTQPSLGSKAPYACADELSDVIRQLSGRLTQ